MDKKIIALATGDLHYHHWKTFNETMERTQVTTNFLAHIFNEAEEKDVPIFHTGDLFHTSQGLSTKTLCEFMIMMAIVRDTYNVIIYGISGNHDLDKGDSLWGAMCFAFPDIFINLDNALHQFNNFDLVGIPYIKRNVGLVEKIEKLSQIKRNKILLLHTALYGALDPSGYELEPQNLPRQLNALFKDFELVLAGHIHKYTQVGNNIHMVGAPNQQRKSDAGCDMGYLEIYDDFSVKFIKYDAPQFRYYKEGEEHEDTNDFWIEIPKSKKLKKQSEAEFKPTMSKETMARRYAEETGIKSPRKIRALIDILNETDD